MPRAQAPSKLCTRIFRLSDKRTGLHTRKKKAPPDWQGFSLSLFAVFRLALSGGFLFLGEGFSQAVHGGRVIDAFDSSELTGHAVQGALIELAL